MKRIRNIHHPFNYGFTLQFDEFPEEFIEVLGAPGKFVKKANTQVKLPDGKTGEIDVSYIADPDGKIIFERCISILEHQRQVVRKEKGYMITNYVIQGVADEKLPFIVSIASHHESEKHLQEYARTKSFIVRLNFIDLGERDNWERLNNIRNKLRFKKIISVKDGLNLGAVILFAPEDCAQERTREALYYFSKYEIECKRLEFVLYSVFYCMIDRYFEDDDEFNRMIDMLDKKASSETTKKFESNIRRENRLKQVTLERDEAIAKLNQTDAEKNEAIAKLNQTDAEKNEAIDIINILFSKFVDRNNEEVKKILDSYQLLKNYNV